jgi:hypothetical protein
MDKTAKPAIRGMMTYAIILLALGIAAGAYFTIHGDNAGPLQRSAAETLPAKIPAPQ